MTGVNVGDGLAPTGAVYTKLDICYARWKLDLQPCALCSMIWRSQDEKEE